MSYTHKIDSFMEKLSSDIELSTKHEVLTELCDIVDSFLGTREYQYFLNKTIPTFIKLLNDIPISFYINTFEHKIRFSILEVFQRLILNDVFEPYKSTVLDSITNTLKNENELNGVLCIKIITSIHKSYKSDLVEKVQEFVDIINQLYSNCPEMVEHWFNGPANEQSNENELNIAEVGEDLNDDDTKKEVLHSMHSFKTLSECPITMVSLLSSYKQLVNDVLAKFIPKIIESLQLEVDVQKKERKEAESKGKRFYSVSKKIKNRNLYGEFIVSQVKVTSFLAYIFIRDYSQEVSKYHEIIPDLVIRLLQDCPSELAAAKKELLHATRHILSTPHKKIFIPKLDELFDERILLGDGLTSYETLRPLAYTAVADFVHNIRAELTPTQLWKAITMFSRLLKDETLNTNVSLMCAKLLLNLLEKVLTLPPTEARQLFMIIIDSFCQRFESVNNKYDYFMKQHEEHEKLKLENEKKQSEYLKANNSKLPANAVLDDDIIVLDNEKDLDMDSMVDNEIAEIPNFDYNNFTENKDEDLEMTADDDDNNDNIGDEKFIKTVFYSDFDDLNPIQISRKSTNDPVRDIKILVKSLINYLKPMVIHLKSTNPEPPESEANNDSWKALARGFTIEEMAIFNNLFKQGILSIKYFQVDKAGAPQVQQYSEKHVFDTRTPSLPITATKDEKESMESLSVIFMKVDPVIFNEIMREQFSFMVEQMVSNPALLHIPHFFLSNDIVSGNFMGILITYLKSRLHELGELDFITTHVLLRLFKLFFLSLNLYPQQNEDFIVPHLQDFILKSMEYSTETKNPLIYFYFIRILFKSISGGRFEKLYKEVIPLMQKLLETLNEFIDSARTPQIRDTCIELCLSIPVRLSKLISVLHLLMRPLVLALGGNADLITQGLRTLELCVENLNANYFDPIIEPVIDDVMKALWKLLKPRSQLQTQSHVAVRILGKLGGRNRNFIKPPNDLEPLSDRNEVVEASFNIEGLKDRSYISVTSGLSAAINIIEDSRLSSSVKLSVHYKISAFKYINAVLMLFIGSEKIPENYESLIRSAVQTLSDKEFVDQINLSKELVVDERKLKNDELLVTRLLKAVFDCSTIQPIQTKVRGLVINLSNHFTQLHITKSLIGKIKHDRKFSVLDGEGKVYLDLNLLFDVLMQALSSELPEVKNLGILSIKQICEASNIIFGNLEDSLKFGIHSDIISVFYHACYDQKYYNKYGGVLGLKTLITEVGIPIKWFSKFQNDIIRALFYVIRDTISIMPAKVVNTAKELVLLVVKGCNDGLKSTKELPMDIVGGLVYDLASSNKKVRKTAQESLEILSKISNVPRVDLISSCKSVLLKPIFAKPLRALPFLMQIGHIEAITYWLKLPHKEAEFNEEIQRLLVEVVTLVEAEDSLLVSSDKLIDHEVREQLTQLRVVCIELLTVALTKNEYAMTEPGLTRLRILAIFFKTLGSSEKAIVDASHLGLKSALAQNNKLPKDLLQNGLRPMLMNLSDHRKLTVSNLETVSRLLVVLVNYFKVEIGKKLLDHAKSWSSPEILSKAAVFDLSNTKAIQIVNAIFNIFHLLPPKAYIFIPDVIASLKSIEFKLRRVSGSICRDSIVNFLDKYPTESVDYFFKEFESRTTQNLHAYFIEKCPELNKTFKSQIEKFYTNLLEEKNYDSKIIKFANFVDILNSASKNDVEWLITKNGLFLKLFDYAKNLFETYKTNPFNQKSTPMLFYSIRKLESVLINFVKVSKNHELLFSLIEFSVNGKISCLVNIENFLVENIVKNKDPEVQKSYLKFSIENVLNDKFSIETKVYLLKRISIPIIINEGEINKNVEKLFVNNDEWLKLLQSKIWRSTDESLTGKTANEIDTLRLELLQLTTVLLKYSKNFIEIYKKDVIKFSWNLMKIDDAIPKYAAYLTTCYFINAYETPEKITTHTFFALLKTTNTDARHLVKQSLDLLANVIEERFKDQAKNWLNWPRRVIAENNLMVNNLFNVYKFMVEHEQLFFNARSQFLSNAINSMGKLTISPNPSSDNQTLAIELSELIVKWEIRAHDLEVDKEGKIIEDFKIPLGQKEAFITFLIRYLCISSTRCSATDLGRRALSVLYDSMKLWNEVSVSLLIFERFVLNNDLDGGNHSILGYCWNTLEVLGMFLENKTSDWIIENLSALHKLLHKVIKSHNHDIQEVLQRVLRIILKSINDESDDDIETEEVKSFMNFLITVIASDLNSSPSSLAAGITLFSTVSYYQPGKLTQLIPSLIKAFGKLCKDHVSYGSTNRHTNSQENIQQVEEESKLTIKMLNKILDFATIRISYFGDHRRVFLSILAQFIERTSDKGLSKHIVDMVYKWVFSNTGAYPTNKEKAGILSKMMGFEPRREVPLSLSKDYLKIIIKIFEDRTSKTEDLTMRLEHSFLIGTRFVDAGIRKRFIKILSDSLNLSIKERLYYVIKEQNWEDLGDFPWLMQALELLFGSFKDEIVDLRDNNYKFAPLSYIQDVVHDKQLVSTDDKLGEFLTNHNEFIIETTKVTTKDIVEPLIEILHNDINSIKSTWIEMFPIIYKSIPKSERMEFSACFASLLSNDYHIKASTSRFNGIQALLEAANKCEGLNIPPHLVKYLGSTFNAHYPAIQNLENQSPTFNHIQGDTTVDDALLEVYMSLEDRDMFYGLWKRKAKYNLTNSAVSFEQIGMFDMALRYYENAQIKIRTKALPYSEAEYSLWEDNWINCAEKLQHWDVLTELAKHETYTDLLLECGWRVANWIDDKEPLEQSVKNVMDVPTPRRQIFQTFLCLQDFAQQKKTLEDVLQLCEEGIKLSVQKWASLPTRFTNAHINMLHVFQQYVEFGEAAQTYASLRTTNTQNIEVKSQELKRMLQAWRERLPNVWEDINIWNDLIIWRKHFFDLVNNIYIPFLQAGKGNTYSQVYCGYHETACVINRFAHVARKHNIDEVCISQLNKIYNLPNIEIMEAFLKLIEQVKCYYQNEKELYTGLDVISNTNLAYFHPKQKAEFFVLKGMFLAKLNIKDKANHAFGTAVQLDGNLAKAWAKWGSYNYRLFKESSRNADQKEVMEFAKNALVCFLNAVGLYKNSKSRRYLALILWIISLDDDEGTLATQYHTYSGEVPIWYWITFIPQLLTSLSHKEAKFVRKILILIAKSFPQALHFPLRTTKEDFLAIQKQIAQDSQIPLNGSKSDSSHPWEYVEEIMNISKTSYPLLALSLESLVAQITQRFKSNADEDAYRLIAALYNDGMQSFNRMLSPKGDGTLPDHMIDNLIKFAETVLTNPVVRKEFEKDFIDSKPNYDIYIKKLIKWKERFENKLDRRLNKINLEKLCPHLTEFHHQKFEDIEVPGQYLLNKSNNTYFKKIERFLPNVDVVRGFNACYKKLSIRSKDGEVHQFAVQFPSNRHSRREERIFQLFRIFDGGIVRNVQCRSRNASLTLPIAVALSPHIRILSNDDNDITLQDVYEQVCKEKNQRIEEPFFYITDKLKATFDSRLPKPDIISTMTEIFSAAQTLYAPTTLVHDYFINSYSKYEDFWLFRRQFTSQYASFIFMTFMMSITSRQPQKIHINMSNGSVWTSEMLPNKASRSTNDNQDQKIPVFTNTEAVPFRLTPNIQRLIGNVGLEGVLAVHILVISRALSNQDFDIENFLSLFVRDEVISWFAQNLQSSAQGPHLRDIVRINVDLIYAKIQRIGHISSSTPVTTQAVNEIIASAVNPKGLAQLDYLWRPYL